MSRDLPTRRSVVRAGAALAGGVALAGCLGGGDAPPVATPPAEDGRTDGTPGGTAPDADTPVAGSGRVYVPPHFHERRTAGTGRAGGYAVGLAYSVPDYYWSVDGTGTRQVRPVNAANLQLLAYVWAPDAGTVLPDVDVTATVRKDGTDVGRFRLVPMLSQRWGIHHATNVALDTYGEYDVELAVSARDAVRTRGFRDAFAGDAGVELTLPFDRADVEAIGTTYLDQANQEGAVRPLEDGTLPVGRGLDPAELPGSVVAAGASGAASVTVSAVPPDASPLADGRAYLAAALATPFNGYVLPRARLEATLERDGETAFDGELSPTVDPERGYHYGAAVEGVGTGDVLRLAFGAPPQIARREGYEEAFLEMGPLEFRL